MDGWRLLTSGAVLAATFAILYLRSLPREHVGSALSRNLVIGVLSARDHFLQRDAIRRTWGSLVSDLPNSEVVFLVGEYDCPFPPEDRVSPYSCEKWEVVSDDVEDSRVRRFFKREAVQEKESDRHFECHVGIGFEAIHPIVLESISVSRDFLSRVGNCTVILQDAEEVLESMEVALKSCREESTDDDYCDVSLPSPLLLPREFEGELRILKTGISEIDFCGHDYFSLRARKSWVCDWTDSSVVKFKSLRSVNDALTKWSATPCPVLSATYSVADRDVLKKHYENELNRKAEWQDHLDFVFKKIAIEQVVHRDLIVLPHLDVYSKLPQKLLLILRRLTLEFDSTYVMKVDDDTFVNITSLKMLLNSPDDGLPRMWSRFHHHRSVPLYGKWADVSYPSLTYPSFPAGAGYLMSGSLLQSLSQASPHLTSHSGEDVSMGIWVSSVVEGAVLIDVPCWLPRVECQETVLIPQLSPITMMEFFKEHS